MNVVVGADNTFSQVFPVPYVNRYNVFYTVRQTGAVPPAIGYAPLLASTNVGFTMQFTTAAAYPTGSVIIDWTAVQKTRMLPYI